MITWLINTLSTRLCGGSSRKLIAGWWYAILFVALLLGLMIFWAVASRGMRVSFATIWLAIVIISLSVGGTIVMRKFHSSFAVGLFMGSVVGTSQFFFVMFLIFLGFAREQRESALPSAQESVESILCLTQAILLASFAVILSAHQSDILDKKSENNSSLDCNDSVSYSPPTL